jgi:hypothetical protein
MFFGISFMDCRFIQNYVLCLLSKNKKNEREDNMPKQFKIIIKVFLIVLIFALMSKFLGFENTLVGALIYLIGKS